MKSERQVAELEAEVARLTKMLDVCAVTHDHNVKLKAEVERLRTVVGHCTEYENKLEAMVNDMSAHTQEQERAAIVAFLIRLFDDAQKVFDKPFTFDALHDAAFRVCNGEHWPEGDKPNGVR